MKQVTISTADDVHLLARRMDFHIFRGQKNDLPVKSKLARVLEGWKVEPGNYRNRESNAIRQFASRISIYERTALQPGDKIGCCSLMQHYGAPTRLIDFTLSLYVALFFAVEDIEHTGDSVVWCLNEMMIRDRAVQRENVRSDDGNDRQSQYDKMCVLANKELASDTSDCSELLLIDPPVKNERLSRQQGCFLFPKKIDTDLSSILVSHFSCAPQEEQCSPSDFDKINSAEIALKIVVRESFRKELVRLLWKMNIQHEVLFPGMDGFCKSMFFHCGVS